MHAVVVYETSFGNTEAIARAIADGLTVGATVDVVDAAGAPQSLADDVDLLVVGATHAFSLSRVGTRQDAVGRGASATAVDRGVREWLAALSPGRLTASMAAFDTKVARPRLPGSAARAAHRRMRRMGLSSLDRPHTFRVAGTAGPLVDGELERARGWGRQLAEQWGPRRGRADRPRAERSPAHATRIAPETGVTAFDGTKPFGPDQPGGGERDDVDMTIDGPTLHRQTQIWTNLYGPARAAELAVRAEELAAAEPEMAPRALFDAVEPDDSDTYTDFVATRW